MTYAVRNKSDDSIFFQEELKTIPVYLEGTSDYSCAVFEPLLVKYCTAKHFLLHFTGKCM